MNKVMRKYNKWILAVLGVILMVTFLVQGTAQMYQGNAGNVVRATMGERKITAEQMWKAESEYRFLREVAPAVVRGLLGVESGTHWYLLTHEVEKAGLFGEAQDGAEFAMMLADYQAETGSRLPAQFRNMPQFQQMIDEERKQARTVMENRTRIAAGAGLRNEQEADLAIAKLRGVMRLVRANNLASRMSDRLATVGLKRVADTLITDVVEIPATRLVDSTSAPTEEELKAHFDKYRTTDPAESENAMGYVLPPRVKVEWLALDKATVTQAIKLDPVAVNSEYLRNRDKYKGEFAAERTNIEKAMTDQRVARVLDEADRAVKGAVRTAIRTLADDGVFKAIPADWKAPSMKELGEAIVHSVKTAAGVDLPPLAVQSRSEWLTQDEFRQIPGLGTATIRMGARPPQVSDVVFAVKELDASKNSGLQVGLPYITAPTVDGAETHYYFAVTGARVKGPAESLDEVRQKVEKDVRLLKAFDRLAADAPAHQALAVAEGLDAVAKQFDSPGAAALTPAKNVKIGRNGAQPSSPARTDKAFVDAVFGVADAIDPLLPPTPENAVQRTVAVPLPKVQTLAVVQITQVRPLTVEQLRTVNEGMLLGLHQQEMEDLKIERDNPYSYTALRARWAFKPVKEDESPEGGEGG